VQGTQPLCLRALSHDLAESVECDGSLLHQHIRTVIERVAVLDQVLRRLPRTTVSSDETIRWHVDTSNFLDSPLHGP
jgi:hypothetical protein